MKHTIIFLLLTALILSLTGCRFNFMEPEEMQDFLDGVVENIGDSQITDDTDLIGTRILTDSADAYTGEYTSQCESATGRDMVFGGASIHNRELFLSGTVRTGSGKAIVRIRLNEEVYELEPDADGYFETTLKLDNGGNYIMVVYDGFSGTVNLDSKYVAQDDVNG